MIRRLAHACIISQDLEEAEKFYCGALGLEKTFDFVRNGQVYGFYLAVGNGTFLEVFLDIEERPQGRIQHLCFEVDDMDRTVDAIRAIGIECTDKILGADQSWQCWLKDPAGIRIELHEYTNESCQITGKDCVRED